MNVRIIIFKSIIYICINIFFFFKQKPAYGMCISDWSADVCSSDLLLNALSVKASGETPGATRERMGDTGTATIGVFCRQSIAGRYPFASGSSRDVAPNVMARLFAPNGMMDDFFQKHLATQIDVSGSRWRFKPGIDGQQGDKAAYLDSFQRASVIRDVYFTAGSPLPSYRVAIRPLEMDAQITQFLMDVDGQTVRHAQGPQEIGRAHV